jgi:glucokinase
MSTVWWPIMAAGCVIGVDLGGTKLLAGTVDSKLEVHHRAYRLARADDAGGLIDQLVEAVQEAAEAAPAPVLAVGLGIPCLVDPETGVALDSNHLPLRGVAVRDLLAERLGLPVAVDNDANAAMLAESRVGEARGARNAVMLTLGTGIGGGLLVDGRIVRGTRGAAAELGHIIVDADGPPCPGSCPNHGCLEALVSGHAIGAEGLRRAGSAPSSALGQALHSGREITGALVTELAHDGDLVAREVMTLMGERLGLGIVTLVNIFNPEVVVIGGGAIAAGELLLAPAREVVASRALAINREDVRLVSARFGAESGMLGAACMALDLAGVAVAVPSALGPGTGPPREGSPWP